MKNTESTLFFVAINDILSKPERGVSGSLFVDYLAIYTITRCVRVSTRETTNSLEEWAV